MADVEEGRRGARLPEQVMLPLLERITAQSLDEDYRVVAEQKATRRDGVSGFSNPRRSWLIAAAVVAVFGVLVSTAAVQTSRNADVDSASRATLIERIENQRDRVGEQQERIARLRGSNADEEQRSRRLVDSLQDVNGRLQRLEVMTGFVPVVGEGVRVTVDDAESGDVNGIVKDSDLALLANALWSAGAEAISINGQRLTAMSAIRKSGQAIEVNSVGIAPPYTVLAIGDGGRLEANFYDTSSGLAFADLTRTYGIPFSMQNEDQLLLPSAPARLRRLRSAEAGTSDDIDRQPGEEA